MKSPGYPKILDYSSPIDSSKKNIIESYPTQWYSDFLIMACRVAQGDFDKRIKPLEIWAKLGLKAIQDSHQKYVIDHIVNILASNSLIKKRENNDISVTEKGIENSVKLTNEPYTNFGLLSPSELEGKSKTFIYSIYNHTRIRREPIPFSEIQELFGGIPHLPALKNMIKFYHSKRWINYDEHNQLISATEEGLEYALSKVEKNIMYEGKETFDSSPFRSSNAPRMTSQRKILGDRSLVEDWYKRGMSSYQSQKYYDALDSFELAIVADPSHIGSWFYKGLIQGKLGEYPLAIDSFNRVIEIDPSDADAWFNKGYVLGRIEKYNEAINCYDKATEIDPLFIHAWHNKGKCFLKLGKYKEAINCFDKAIEIDPKNVNSWNDKGVILLISSIGSPSQAAECFDMIIKIDPHDSKAWNNKALALSFLKKHNDAIYCFDKAIEIDPTFANPWYNKANTLDDIGRYNEAIYCYNKAIENDPYDADAWNNMGVVFHKIGAYDKAIESFSKALDLDRLHKNAYYNRGVAYHHLGIYDKAIESYSKAILLDPGNLKIIAENDLAKRHLDSRGSPEKEKWAVDLMATVR